MKRQLVLAQLRNIAASSGGPGSLLAWTGAVAVRELLDIYDRLRGIAEHRTLLHDTVQAIMMEVAARRGVLLSQLVLLFQS